MEPFTYDRNFLKQDIIGVFSSLIWTERYYGDSEVELVVEPTREMIQKLPVGTFLGLDHSDKVMILETANIEGDKLKLTGISLLKWLNNRFVRTSNKHEDRYWYIENMPAGQILWTVVYNMCCVGSPYLNGTINTGISNPQALAIPGLGLYDYDTQGNVVKVGVPFGPVFDALKEIATTNEIGMQIIVNSSPTAYSLGFRSFRGLDRTSRQSLNPIVRFSPQMESFTDIKELQSIATFKTLAYVFAPGNPNNLATGLAPGVASLSGAQYTGFDLRASLVFAEDITTDQVTTSANLLGILNTRAADELNNNKFVKAVDGEIVPDSEFQYGADYFLGDVIEVQGNSGVVQTARITEYIRSQDSAGEKAYPTVAMIDN